jgi:gamma-glutamyltranspeptidase/glutathione hydrolase
MARLSRLRRPALLVAALAVLVTGLAVRPGTARTAKPVLHARHWIAITGKPLAATAGAMMFQKGGNAVDAACAMLGATSTMWDTLGWGGETQALIWNPKTKKVIGINALGVAPTGATPEFFHGKNMAYPPEYGPLAAVTPGTPGGLLVMLAEYGRLSLAEVLEPSIQMADGFAIEAQLTNRIEAEKKWIKEWPASRAVFLTHPDEPREAPRAGEVFRQSDLAATLRKLVEAERQALAQGKSRKEAILAAYDRFYKGDIAEELARGTQEQGGLITREDLAQWQVKIEEPVKTTYKGIDVYKLTVWTQGPAMLQALNILEPLDLRGMGLNSSRYIHTIYQAMNLAFADRDFYYGDPAFPPEEPVQGLLSKSYAETRRKLINPDRNDPAVKPGDPYPFEGAGKKNPYLALLEKWGTPAESKGWTQPHQSSLGFDESFRAGTTSIEAADAEGWVVSVTPSGGWVPAFIAGRTGIGLSQRMQSFVLEEGQNPFNVLVPGKRPRVTLTPTLAVKDNKPYLAFAVQGGDTQDQNLLQFFLNVVEFGMNVQEAAEGPNVNSYQMRSSFGDHEAQPGRITVHAGTPPWCAPSCRKWATRSRSKSAPPAPSTPSFSITRTAPCGAAPATTGRTTGSGGEKGGPEEQAPPAFSGPAKCSEELDEALHGFAHLHRRLAGEAQTEEAGLAGCEGSSRQQGDAAPAVAGGQVGEQGLFFGPVVRQHLAVGGGRQQRQKLRRELVRDRDRLCPPEEFAQVEPEELGAGGLRVEFDAGFPELARESSVGGVQPRLVDLHRLLGEASLLGCQQPPEREVLQGVERREPSRAGDPARRPWPGLVADGRMDTLIGRDHESCLESGKPEVLGEAPDDMDAVAVQGAVGSQLESTHELGAVAGGPQLRVAVELVRDDVCFGVLLQDQLIDLLEERLRIIVPCRVVRVGQDERKACLPAQLLASVLDRLHGSGDALDLHPATLLETPREPLPARCRNDRHIAGLEKRERQALERGGGSRDTGEVIGDQSVGVLHDALQQPGNPLAQLQVTEVRLRVLGVLEVEGARVSKGCPELIENQHVLGHVELVGSGQVAEER